MRTLLPVLALGCVATNVDETAGDDSAASTDDRVDYRVPVPAVGDHQLQFASPEITVEPFTETIQCYYGTYDGPTVGMTRIEDVSHEAITHHSGVMAVGDTLYPDGALVDCMDQGADGMGIYAPFFMPVGVDAPGGEPPDLARQPARLPDGAAFRLNHGQRWALDLHYINFNDQPAVTNTVYTVDVVPADDVDQWVGAVLFDSAPFTLPQGPSEITFECNWQEDFDVLTLMAHMHEYGAGFEVELERRYGGTEVIFSVDDWTPAHKDFPPARALEVGELHVEPGDTFRTTCRWNNETGADLPYPAEMCTLEIVAMPLEQPLLCVDGWYVEAGEAPRGR